MPTARRAIGAAFAFRNGRGPQAATAWAKSLCRKRTANPPAPSTRPLHGTVVNAPAGARNRA